ncbi:hypothetical protein M0805_003118 [Coniferiporia weirii]|nr:hypothetical protein M0805_003118 [Coniferiporia weirii]
MASSSLSTLRTSVSIAPTTLADLPAAAECELLAFSGAFPPYDRFPHILCPFRAPLARAGVHPRLWPDYTAAIRRHTRELRDGLLLFTAFAPDDDGNVRVAGMAVLEPPRAAKETVRANRKWTERALADYVYPSVDVVQDKLWSAPSGVDFVFRSLADEAFQKGRREFMRERDCYILRMVFVHPHIQRRGVGSALLVHCSDLADAAHVPLYLEASSAGAPLYTARGFRTLQTLRLEYKGEVILIPAMAREPAGEPAPPPNAHVAEVDTASAAADAGLHDFGPNAGS